MNKHRQKLSCYFKFDMNYYEDHLHAPDFRSPNDMEQLIKNLYLQIKSNPMLMSNCHIIAPLIDEELRKNNISSTTIVGNLWIKILNSQKSVSYLLKDGGTGHAWNKVFFKNETYLLDISIFHQHDIVIPSNMPILLPYNTNDDGCISLYILDENNLKTHEVIYQDSNISNYYASKP